MEMYMNMNIKIMSLNLYFRYYLYAKHERDQ